MPRQSVELRARGAVGKHRAGDGEVTLEHEGDFLPHVGIGLADGDGGDVDGSVLVSAAGFDEEQLARRDAAIGFAGDAIMDHGAVRVGVGLAAVRRASGLMVRERSLVVVHQQASCRAVMTA